MYYQEIDINMDRISGSKNGYAYQLMQVVENSKFFYMLTNPSGVSKMFHLDAEAVKLMTSDPAAFWQNNTK